MVAQLLQDAFPLPAYFPVIQRLIRTLECQVIRQALLPRWDLVACINIKQLDFFEQKTPCLANVLLHGRRRDFCVYDQSKIFMYGRIRRDISVVRLRHRVGIDGIEIQICRQYGLSLVYPDFKC